MAAGIQIASLFAKISGDTRGLEKALSQSESMLQRTATSISKIGKGLTIGVTLPIVAAGVAAGKLAIDFDSAMMGVNSVLKLSGEGFQTLKSDVLEFSTQTSKSSADVANSLRGIVSSGFEAADAMDILKVAVDSAGNMMVGTATTTLALTSTLRAFGMEATDVTHVADVLQTAANNSAIVFDQLTTSIGTALGSAAAAGVSFEETAAALMTITDAGYSTAIATTNLNAIISALLKPGADLVNMIAEWGYESGEAALQAIGLQGVMSLLTEATGGSASELATLLPNIRAFKGAVALAREGGDAFADSLDEVAAASLGAGEHAAMAAIRHESWAYQLTKLKSEVEVFAIRLANTFMPAVIDVVNVLKDWATKLATLPAPMLELIAKVAILAAVLGPVLLILGKLITIGISVASGLSAMASGVSLVVTAVGILTGASTMLGAALMTIAPLALIAGLALLAVKIRGNIKAHKELAAEAIHVSSTYTEYRQAVEDSSRWTTVLSEEVWKLVDAKIALQNATGAAAAALATEGIEQQKLLDTLSDFHKELERLAALQDDRTDGIARAAAAQEEGTRARMLAVAQLVLQDEALRKVALSLGLVTEEQVALVEGVEASDRAMLLFAKSTQELREQTGFYTEALKQAVKTSQDLIVAAGGVGGVMAEIAMKAEQAAGKITSSFEGTSEVMLEMMAAVDGVSPSMNVLMGKMKETHDAVRAAVEGIGQALGDLGSSMESGWSGMAATMDQYLSAMLASQSQYDQQMAEMAESGALARFSALEKYQLSQAQATARYEAEAAALSAAGQTERLTSLTRSFEESSAMSQYAFDIAEAQRVQSEAIQTHVAQVAHAQREYDAALSQYNELQETQKFIGNKIMMWIAMHKQEIEMAGSSADQMIRTVGDMFGAELSLADQFNIGWQGFMKDWAEGTGEAIEGAAKFWEGLHQTMKGELDKGAATMAAAQSRLDAIGAGWEPPALQAPAMPDFAQFTADYSGGLSSAGKAIAKSATKSMKQVVVDIAEAFKEAMEIFKEVSEYATPTGLAAGMEALRKDIQEAVRQLYIAYDSIGKEGVEGAGLIAEASGKVFDSIGKAVDTFGKLADYTPPLRSAIDGVLDDVKYVFVKVRTELLDLWGWAGQRKDTVWGHMESWAEAVGGIVGLVGQAAETFTKLKDYTGIMPGAVDALVADIKLVVGKLATAIGGGEGLGTLQVQWAKFAGDLISTVTGMIDDMRTLAGYQGGIEVTGLYVGDLVNKMSQIVTYLQQVLARVPGILDEGTDTVREMHQSWLDFASGLISTMAGVIEDLKTITAYEGGIEVTGLHVGDLVNKLSQAATYIQQVLARVPGILDEGAQTTRAMYQSWLSFAAGLISTVAGVIEDLRTVAAYKGDIQVGFDEVQQLVWQIDVTARNILSAIETVASDFQAAEGSVDQLKAAWLGFSTGLISTVAGGVADLETIAAYEGDIQTSFDDVQQLVWQIDVTARNILDAIDTVVSDFQAAEGSADQLKAAWLGFSTGLISALAGVVEDLGIITRFKGGIVASQVQVESLINALVSVVGWILAAIGDVSNQFEEGEKYVDRLKIAWVEIQKKLITAIADITEGIEGIASFKAVDETKFKIALDATFDALYWFLYEFNERSEQFAGVVSEVGTDIAKLMGDTVKSLGDTLDPLLDVASFSVSPAEAKTAIGLFFDALKLFLDEFESRAVDFAEQADTQTAALATAIGSTVSGIGNAVAPLLQILEYNPEVKDIEARFEEFFGHLGRVLWWIEFEKDNWEVSEAAQELADKVAEVMGHLETAVDFLDEMATYGEDTTAGALAGFLSFLIDLQQVIGAINDARDMIAEEALAAAEEFASGCATLLGHITDGINTLNSLPQLAIDFYLTGEGLSVNFIQGMIDGLVDNASALYQTIASIVAGAIAAAEAAAGVSSPSTMTWSLGENMVAGLVGALEAGQADVQRAMAGLVAAQGLGTPAFAMVGAGTGGAGLGGAAGGDTTYNYNYAYNEAPGVGADTRASLRQDFEAMELYQRLRG